ncbi:MAG: HAMP domain-containing protein [Firmicutes bacterium]|nr:HAMP domain-containing protein [Bacillota bacterium]
MAGEAGVGRYFDPRRQEEVFSAFTPIGDTGWGLIVVQDPKEAFARVRATTTTISVLALLLLTVAVAITLQVANSITRPINLLVGEVKKMSEGDLTGEIKISSQDEIGDLANNFNKMVANLNTDLLNINAAAEQVAAGANQLAVSSQSLSDGTTEQASSIQEITATVTQIAAQTKENAVNANQAAELTLKAKEIAVEGNRQMEEMVEAMAQINDSSSNISKVIKAIDDLAFQTNILALNAAVEAARAGQHGKGFAVVAEEVRNLAARSANAAQETTVMIEDSIHKAEVGMKIARKTAEELDQIEETVNQAAALVAKIATASNEQATGIAQINQAIDQVSEVVQSNSATAEETASASEELSSQAELMKNSVRKFKLKKGKQVMGGTDVFTLEKIRPFAKVVGKGNHYPLYGEEEIVRESVPADGENSLFSISRQEDNYGKY